MTETDSPSPKPLPSTARLEGVIIMLTLLIKIGRYLPWIVLAFAGINMTLAVFCFALWNSVTGGIVNVVLAIAGFLFFGQLVSRRKIHRSDYRHAQELDSSTNRRDRAKKGGRRSKR